MTSSTGAMVLRLLLSLGFVLGLLVVAARIARRRGTGPRRVRGGMAVVSRASLGRNAAVVVVELDGRGLVLGVTPSQVNLLGEHELPAAQPAALESGGRTPPSTGWKPVLDALRERTVRRA